MVCTNSIDACGFSTRNWALRAFERAASVTCVLGGKSAEGYSGRVGTGASGSDARAERSMAMAAYAMTAVTAHRISVR